MLRKQLKSCAGKTYFATSLLLCVTATVDFALRPWWMAIPEVISIFCFAALSCAFAVLEEKATLSAASKELLAGCYGLGTILMFSTFILLDRATAWLHDAEWLNRLTPIGLVFPVLILLPIGATLRSTFRYSDERSGRAYILGGLCLLVLCVGKFAASLFNIAFSSTARLPNSILEVLWVPLGMVVATTGVLIGSMRHELPTGPRQGPVSVICFLTGAGLILVGFYSSPDPPADGVHALGLLATTVLGFCIPASVMVREWIECRPWRTHATEV